MQTTPAPPTRVPAAPRSWRFPWLVSLGVLLLVGSATGVALALNGHGDRTAAPTPPASPSASKQVAIAYVDVEPGLTALHPVQPGRVTEVLLEENKEVEPGTPLFRLDDTLAKSAVAGAKTDLEAAEVRLEQARQLIKQHAAKVEAQRALIAVRRREAEAARAQHAKAQRYYENKLGGSEEDVQSAAKLAEKAEAAVTAEEKNLAALKTLDPAPAVKLAELAVRDKREQLAKAEYGLKECTVVAPCKGSVLRSLLTVGQVLGSNPTQPVVLFCPSGPRIVRAEVEQEFAGRVAVGQTAHIKDDATGGGAWTGKVKSLSGWYSHRRSMLLEPLQFNDVRTLECIITLDPDPTAPPLRIGQRVRVTLEGAGS